MQRTDDCVVCGLKDQPTGPTRGRDAFRTNCQRCGQFDWNPLRASFGGWSRRQVLMSGYIRSKNNLAIIPYFNAELIAVVEPLLRHQESQSR